MALDTDARGTIAEGPVCSVKPSAGRLATLKPVLSSASAAWRWLARRFYATWLHRLFTASLARRIFVANILGLLILLGGIHWLSQHSDWLIAAKRESLRVQSEIVAAAVAASATVDTDRITFDPDRLTEVGASASRAPFRDDGFAAFELSLRPDKVGPVLRRLIQPSHNTRARIYDREGELIVDTAQVGATGFKPTPAGERIAAKTPWTRILSFFDGSDLPLYREIGAGNGNAYSEVKQALKGLSPEPMLLLNENGKQIVSLAVPIQRRNITLGALLLSTKPGEIDSILAKEQRIIRTLTIMALIATLVASWILTRMIAGPMHRLSAAAEQVSESINARAELPDYSDRTDEVGQLAQSFKHMTAALYRRIEAADTFAADVAHELKNPLAACRVMADTMKLYAKTPEQREHFINEIQNELVRLDRLISDVSEASRLEADIGRQTNETVELPLLLDKIVTGLRDIHAGKNLKIELEVDPVARSRGALDVWGHAGRLGRVITNLVDNAISFSPEGGTVAVKARTVGSEIEVTIDDEGRGIPDGNLEKIFERFYSDRPESDQTIGKNSGLGLSISRLIVEGHRGRIWAENRHDGRVGGKSGSVSGARFVIRLPASITGSKGQGAAGRRI